MRFYTKVKNEKRFNELSEALVELDVKWVDGSKANEVRYVEGATNFIVATMSGLVYFTEKPAVGTQIKFKKYLKWINQIVEYKQ